MLFRNLFPRLRNNTARPKANSRTLNSKKPTKRARVGSGLRQGTKPPFSG